MTAGLSQLWGSSYSSRNTCLSHSFITGPIFQPGSSDLPSASRAASAPLPNLISLNKSQFFGSPVQSTNNVKQSSSNEAHQEHTLNFSGNAPWGCHANLVVLLNSQIMLGESKPAQYRVFLNIAVRGDGCAPPGGLGLVGLENLAGEGQWYVVFAAGQKAAQSAMLLSEGSHGIKLHATGTICCQRCSSSWRNHWQNSSLSSKSKTASCHCPRVSTRYESEPSSHLTHFSSRFKTDLQFSLKKPRSFHRLGIHFPSFC